MDYALIQSLFNLKYFIMKKSYILVLVFILSYDLTESDLLTLNISQTEVNYVESSHNSYQVPNLEIV